MLSKRIGIIGVIMHAGEVELWHAVFCPVLPGCHTQSETIEEGIQNIREAIQLYVQTLIEDGLPVPEEDILLKPPALPGDTYLGPRLRRIAAGQSKRCPAFGSTIFN